jgi:putative ABC transport system ATP-binding protein
MSTQPSAVLSARGIGKVFGADDLAVRALRPTDLEVRRGEVLVIMGPSGSGKTTLLSILGLLLRPSEGEVFLQGRAVTRSDEEALTRLRRDNIGFVFQQINLLSGLSALENVAMPLLVKDVPAVQREAMARRMLAEVGLAGKEQAKPRQLSGGQQQRVAIARALVTGAAVLLCDEPTASLDAVAGRNVLELLRRSTVEMGRAVVIVTHDERVLQYADRMVEVTDGVTSPARRLREEGASHGRQES